MLLKSFGRKIFRCRENQGRWEPVISQLRSRKILKVLKILSVRRSLYFCEENIRKEVQGKNNSDTKVYIGLL